MVNTLSIEKLNEEDIDQIVKLSAIIEWDYSASDLQTIFASGIVFGHKTEDGELVSNSAIFTYEDKLASIGMVMVNPKFQKLGLGKAVTLRCIHSVKNIPIMLIATNEGIPLYEKLGFKQIGTVHKLITSHFQPVESITLNKVYTLSPYKNSHFEEIIVLDKRAVGANRRDFIKARMNQANEIMVIKDCNNNIVSYGASIQLKNMLLIGPIIARDVNQARVLIYQLGKNQKGKIRIDLLSDHISLINSLLEDGFEIVKQPPIMLLNADKLLNRNGTLFAIAAQAFG